jgi:hypothetical protein
VSNIQPGNINKRGEVKLEDAVLVVDLLELEGGSRCQVLLLGLAVTAVVRVNKQKRKEKEKDGLA